MSESGYLLVWCTCPAEVAESIAHTLVDESLAACVNRIGPMQSTYRWQGVIESASEILLVIKTRTGLYSSLQTRLQALHPYEVPEILATSIEQGLPEYLAWVAQSTASS